ncbi:hypothetical protein PUN28_004318 [Cardiocondyla obscurior]
MCGEPSGIHATHHLHCISKEKNTLTCRLRYVDGATFGTANEKEDLQDAMDTRAKITDAPFDLIFNEDGIESIVMSKMTRPYDINLLKVIIELLHVGDDFDDIEDGTFDSTATSTIGRCNVTFHVFHRSTTENAKTELPYRFRLKAIPPKLHLTPNENLVIYKVTHLNHCDYYAEHYFRKYGDTVVSEYVEAELENMVSQMELSETSFSSSTLRKGISITSNKIYNIIENTKITLKDVQSASSELPAIVKPAKTGLIANDDIISLSSTNYINID